MLPNRSRHQIADRLARKILGLKSEGLTTPYIAFRCGCTPRWVQKIVAAFRAQYEARDWWGSE